MLCFLLNATNRTMSVPINTYKRRKRVEALTVAGTTFGFMALGGLAITTLGAEHAEPVRYESRSVAELSRAMASGNCAVGAKVQLDDVLFTAHHPSTHADKHTWFYSVSSPEPSIQDVRVRVTEPVGAEGQSDAFNGSIDRLQGEITKSSWTSGETVCLIEVQSMSADRSRQDSDLATLSLL